MIIATASAVSAAATAIIKIEKKTPCNTSGYKYLLMTTKFIGEGKNFVDANTGYHNLSSFLVSLSPFPMMMAPIIAANNSTLMTSKGKINPPAS
jgi:hypothetical protein